MTHGEVFVFTTVNTAKDFQDACEARGLVTACVEVAQGLYFVAVKEA